MDSRLGGMMIQERAAQAMLVSFRVRVGDSVLTRLVVSAWSRLSSARPTES